MKLPKLPESATDPKKPRTLRDTIFTSTPVIMTVVATVLAGLSSSEMNQSQYHAAMSAKNQSKVGDQWAFFQAKKIRAEMASDSLALLKSTGNPARLSPDSFAAAAARPETNAPSAATTPAATMPSRPGTSQAKVREALADPDVKQAMDAVNVPMPAVSELTIAEANVRTAYDAMKKDEGDAIPPAVMAAMTPAALDEAIRAARLHAKSEEDALNPAAAGLAKLQRLVDGLAAAAGPSDRQSPVEIRQLAADLSAAKLQFDAARYGREARLNQQTAYLHEIAVRKSTWQAEHSRQRSRYFFFGFLGAQAAVTIATVALAARERSALWGVAATMGVLAVSYAGYIYVFK